MDLLNLVAAAAAIAAGSVVQRISGVGGGFIFVPVLAMLDTGYLPGPIVFATIALSVLMAWRERQHVDYRTIPVILLGFLPGAAVGAWVLTRVAPGQLGIVFGTTILVAVLISGLGLHLPLNRLTGSVAGLVSGVMGASTGIGAPPLAMLYQHHPGRVLRSSLAVLYTFCSAVIVIVLAVFGRFGMHEVITGALLVPGFVIGYWLGGPLVSRFEAFAGMRRLVLLVSALAAIALLVKSF